VIGGRPFGADFTKLWSALSISLLGSAITTLALPLIAARSLGASALQMGTLAAAGQTPRRRSRSRKLAPLGLLGLVESGALDLLSRPICRTQGLNLACDTSL
jgi:hypothetical protein